MAASRSLAGCLTLWLLVSGSGCGTPSLRWNRFARDQQEPTSEELADDTSRELDSFDESRSLSTTENEYDAQPETRESDAYSHTGQPAVTPSASQAFIERYSHGDVPSAPEVTAEVPITTRPVALSGVIDDEPEPLASGLEQFAGHSEQQAIEFPVIEPAATTTDALGVPGEPRVEIPAATEAANEESPWGLPRIPDVLRMSRLAEESVPSDWTFGIGQRLMPGSRPDEPPSQAEPPIRSASLPEMLPADGTVWSGSSAYSQEELAKLISLIETELAGVTPTTESERRDYLRRHALLRNLYLLAGRPHDAQQVIPDIDPADQEFWTEINWAMASYFDEEMLPNRSDRAAQTVTRLASAQRALDPLVPLEIRNLQFCRHIDGFGNYETFGVNEFTAGQQLLLYTEVQHFLSESDPSGVYRTLLESEIEIYSEGATRELIDRTVFPSTEDLCRTRRSDYFHSYRIDLPGALQPGTYVLELTVEDRLAGKSATESRRFVVQ